MHPLLPVRFIRVIRRQISSSARTEESRPQIEGGFTGFGIIEPEALLSTALT
jgi:hypothetical protein